jgi:hypothetical protein
MGAQPTGVGRVVTVFWVTNDGVSHTRVSLT